MEEGHSSFVGQRIRAWGRQLLRISRPKAALRFLSWIVKNPGAIGKLSPAWRIVRIVPLNLPSCWEMQLLSQYLAFPSPPFPSIHRVDIL